MARSLGIDRRKVLALRAKGLTIREVAERLGCSGAAVQYHIYRKTRESIRRSFNKRRKTERYRKQFREYYMKRYHSDSEFRSKHLERTKKYRRERYRSDPEYRAKRLEDKRRRYHSDPEYRAKQIEYAREYSRRQRAKQRNRKL